MYAGNSVSFVDLMLVLFCQVVFTGLQCRTAELLE